MKIHYSMNNSVPRARGVKWKFMFNYGYPTPIPTLPLKGKGQAHPRSKTTGNYKLKRRE